MQTKTNRNSWQTELINAVTDPKELMDLLELPSSLIPSANRAAQLFNLKVPRSFIARMSKGNINDPLLRQVLPLDAEFDQVNGFSNDPLQEKKYNPIPGLLQKYSGRVLIIITSACGINCRYCFRRSFDYEKNSPNLSNIKNAIRYIQEDTSIKEVILSGGDPLVMNDHVLKNIISDLSGIAHLKRVRLHTRMPVVLPSRVTAELVSAISASRLQTICVIHSNHPQELNLEVEESLKLLSRSGISLLNQSVLLKGVNDEVTTLTALSERLFEMNVLPYYLHLLDKVDGAAHFNVSKERALNLYTELKNQLSGYLIPKLVYEKPGELAKTMVFPDEFCTALC